MMAPPAERTDRRALPTSPGAELGTRLQRALQRWQERRFAARLNRLTWIEVAAYHRAVRSGRKVTRA